MLDSIFQGLFDTAAASVISVSDFLLCVACSLVIGLLLAFAHSYKTRSSRGFIATLALLPAVVCVVIMMGAGLISGMGYLAYSLLFTLILGAASLLYSALDFGAKKKSALYKTLHITIPEDLDYTNVFEDIFPAYASSWELTQVKTTNMGSLFRLTYNITLLSAEAEKQLIDKLRCRNGNLEITVSKQETVASEL